MEDVDCEEWKKIHHAAACINTESKVIVVSRKESSVKYGTVKPIRLSRLTAEEYTYLFKTLAFGSADPEDHPNLTPLAIELAAMLGGYKNVTENNLPMFGEHLSLRIRRRAPVDITSFLPSPAAPLFLGRPRTETEVSQRRLPKVTMADLIVDPTIRPKGDFDLVKWKSRLPPYTEFSYFVPSCAEQMHKTTARRKREAAIYP
uniref:NB-ARC domain-containing protein n=1 Tax=Aegilops tauschii TaxID=37682 RepID=M8C613_AEGTA